MRTKFFRSTVKTISALSSIRFTVSVTGTPSAAAPHSNAARHVRSICCGFIIGRAPSITATYSPFADNTPFLTDSARVLPPLVKQQGLEIPNLSISVRTLSKLSSLATTTISHICAHAAHAARVLIKTDTPFISENILSVPPILTELPAHTTTALTVLLIHPSTTAYKKSKFTQNFLKYFRSIRFKRGIKLGA